MKKHKQQASLFAVVGVFNTLLDFTIFNILALSIGLPAVIANIFSTSVGMLVSFSLNRRYVFKSPSATTTRQFVLFIVITAIGLYVFQTAVIELFANQWTTPLEWVHRVVNEWGLSLSRDFVVANGAKVLATAVSMVWNYVMYDRIVFKDD